MVELKTLSEGDVLLHEESGDGDEWEVVEE
jgi:hypothetical protein